MLAVYGFETSSLGMWFVNSRYNLFWYHIFCLQTILAFRPGFLSSIGLFLHTPNSSNELGLASKTLLGAMPC